MAQERVLIVSPVFDEAAHIEAVIRAMAAQTCSGRVGCRRRWLERWHAGASEGAATDIRFMNAVSAPPASLAAGADRLHHAAEARAFNYGMSLASGFTHVGKLDGDIELPPDYYERLLDRFRDDASLGLAGGVLMEPTSRGWQLRGNSDLQHVRGALKLYTRRCFETIGGVREILGWDGVDEVLARMHGYRTRSFQTPSRRHRPPAPPRGGSGSYRLGRSMFIEGYPAAWILPRSVKVAASSQPVGMSGVAYCAGYFNALTRGTPRFEADGYDGGSDQSYAPALRSRSNP